MMPWRPAVSGGIRREANLKRLHGPKDCGPGVIPCRTAAGATPGRCGGELCVEVGAGLVI